MTRPARPDGPAHCPDCGRAVDASTADLCACGYPLMLMEQDQPASAPLKPGRRPLDNGDTDEFAIVEDSPPSPATAPPATAGPDGLRCSACQEVNAPTRTWCVRCGSALRERHQVVEVTEPPRERHPRRRGLLVAGVVALGLLASGGGLLAARALRDDGPKPTDGSDLQADALLDVAEVSASSTAAPSEDEAGKTVVFVAPNVVDRDASTAWRVAGDGNQATLRLDLGRPRTIREVGLIPGYAKTDPAKGTDRFLQNRTVRRVQWTFDGGDEHVQVIDDPQRTPAINTLPNPVTARTVVLTVLETTPGQAKDNLRDFTAISEVVLTGH